MARGMGNKKQAASHSETDPPHSPLPVSAFIGIGSNLGDRLASCREAVRRLGLKPTLRIKKISSLYETDPVDYLKQDRFYNAVIAIETSLSPGALLEECQEIERRLGKKIAIPKGPRTIDLDLLFYHDRIIIEPGLQIPHPAIPDRAFVLIPLIELVPTFIHPVLHISVTNLLLRLHDPSSVRKIALPGWEKIPLVSNGPS